MKYMLLIWNRPGFTEELSEQDRTALFGEVDEIMKDEALLEKAWERIPLRRAGKPEEIAAAVAFLASDEALWITGIVLPVDGGQTCTDGGPEWGK